MLKGTQSTNYAVPNTLRPWCVGAGPRARVKTTGCRSAGLGPVGSKGLALLNESWNVIICPLPKAQDPYLPRKWFLECGLFTAYSDILASTVEDWICCLFEALIEFQVEHVFCCQRRLMIIPCWARMTPNRGWDCRLIAIEKIKANSS